VYNKALLGHPQTHTYADYGTAAMTSMCNAYGALPTRNFSTGQFENADKLSGEHMRQVLVERGGESETTHACMTGCVIRCSNVFGGPDGKAIVSPLEYETIGLMGSNLGIDDLDVVAKLNWEANDLGLDTIELGAALGVAAEAGLMEFGDGKRALELVAEIRQNTPLGKVIGSGATAVGQKYDIKRVPAVKGQAMSAYDPRAIKGTGVTYATSPQGADHTAGLTIRADVDHTDPKGQAKLSREAQIKMAGYDTLGACLFSGFGFGVSAESIPDLLNTRYGWRVDERILLELGRITLKLERDFNHKAGFSSEDDRLPAWMAEEPLSPSEAVFDVPEEDLDSLFDW
jgi:aldehyde:ferredoxin oxidoreductase